MKKTTLRAIASSMALSIALAANPAVAQDASAKPSAAEAKAFMEKSEADLIDLAIKAGRADWVYLNFITEDTEKLTADASARYTEKAVAVAVDAARYARADGLDYDTARKLSMARTGLTTPAPVAPGGADAVAELGAKMQGIYGKGQGTLDGKPISGNDIENAMLTERDPAKLKEMWVSWHDNVGTPMKGDYTRFVELMNQGARDLGYADTGAMWRSNYDMTPEQFAALTERLWQEVKPLYDQLHCYTRTKLNEKYGDEVQAATGPIRADLLGNMWAQQWSTIYDIIAPAGSGDLGYDLTGLLGEKQLRREQDGQGRREFLLIARFCAAARYVLETFVVRQTGRPRSGVPRLGVQHRFQGRPARQDVHQDQLNRFPDLASRAWPQLLSARLQRPRLLLPDRRTRRLPRSDR